MTAARAAVSIGVLSSLVLAAPPAGPAGARDTVLFLGDSLTAGYGVDPQEAFPSLVAEQWEKGGVPFKVRNAGVSGATTADILSNVDWTLADDVSLVFLAIGANDGLRGLTVKTIEANIGAIIRAAQRKRIRVVLAGIKIPTNYGEPYRKKFEALYPRLAKRYKVKLMPFLLKGVGGHPDLTLEDGLHPNAKGHRIIADAVLAFFKKEKLP